MKKNTLLVCLLAYGIFIGSCKEPGCPGEYGKDLCRVEADFDGKPSRKLACSNGDCALYQSGATVGTECDCE
jgi:hypothetical protein